MTPTDLLRQALLDQIDMIRAGHTEPEAAAHLERELERIRVAILQGPVKK